MRFVAVKTPEQQGRLMQHRVRDLLLRQRTQAINALRAHLAELGLVAAQGREGLAALLAIVADATDRRLPEDARASLTLLAGQIATLHTQIGALDKRLAVQHRQCAASRRLATIPGIGVIGASAIAATITEPGAFRSGRDLAAFIGLVPRKTSTGGKQRLGPISKQGDRYLRRTLIVGAHAVLKQARIRPDKHPWLARLLARKPAKVAAVALANKTARIAWAVLVRGEAYRAPVVAAAA
jgi:transposase